MKAKLFLRFIDVVPDDAAEDRSRRTSDDRALHLVPAGDSTDYRTRAGADCRVTLGVLHDRRLGGRRAVDRRRRVRAGRA